MRLYFLKAIGVHLNIITHCFSGLIVGTLNSLKILGLYRYIYNSAKLIRSKSRQIHTIYFERKLKIKAETFVSLYSYIRTPAKAHAVSLVI